jgi:hypothetical protein
VGVLCAECLFLSSPPSVHPINVDDGGLPVMIGVGEVSACVDHANGGQLDLFM